MKSFQFRSPFATLFFWGACCLSVQSAEHFAAPDGLASGSGSIANPWDLTTALSRTDAIGPGDTLYLRGGTYHGGYTCNLKGTSNKPITIRQFVGERAVIDCQTAEGNPTFYISGDWLVLWGFEMTCSDPKRRTEIEGSWPNDIRRGGIECRGSNVKFINLILHDLGQGIGWWSEGEAGEVYGCLIYANGWQGPDREHGHAIYAQNELGTKRIADNIIFNQFGYGIHCYGSEKSVLSGFEIDGNILFDNGALGSLPANANILVGGSGPVSRTTITRNIGLHQGTCARFGYPWGPENSDIAITENFFVGAVSIDRFEQLLFTQNKLHGPNVIEYKPSQRMPLQQNCWNDNSYWMDGSNRKPFMTWQGSNSSRISFGDWCRSTKFDSRSQFVKGSPKETRVFIRPNKYEAGRANLAIFNWTRRKNVEVDLASTLKRGQRFRIFNVQNLYGTPVAEGLYDGNPVSISMLPTEKNHPVGWSTPLPATEPFFAAFLVLTQS